MSVKSKVRTAAKWLAGAAAVGAAVYGTQAGAAWLRYGIPNREDPSSEDKDLILNALMPGYEIVERHSIAVDAPFDITFQTACEIDLEDSRLSRAVFRARERLLGTTPRDNLLPRGILAQTKALGWATLAEVPHHEIVMGAVTQPWLADVVFRGLPLDEFLAFDDPAYVKIVWTLRADRVTATTSVFRTETRALACGPEARAKFRRYWSLVSPGIALIRLTLLKPVKQEAERRFAATADRTV
jgi:hypothetical protein